MAVEAPTYLGALMAFAQAEADVIGIEMDAGGLVVEALEERLEAGARPKLLYVIPEYQNPSGWTLALERREPLIELCRRHGVLIVEDVAYREMAFDTDTVLPSLWSLGPDVVLQAGTFSKIFCPGVRLGWAVGPPEVVEQLAAAKQLTDQCAGGLGQRMVEEYGRAGPLRPPAPAGPRALRRALARAVGGAATRARRTSARWSEPTGGFFTWLTLPEGLDSIELRDAAVEAGVTYVPGPPFYSGDDGHGELRLSFSHLGAGEYDEAVRRLASVIRARSAPARVTWFTRTVAGAPARHPRRCRLPPTGRTVEVLSQSRSLRRRAALAVPMAAVTAALMVPSLAGAATPAPSPIPVPTTTSVPAGTTQGIIMRDGGICDPIRHMGC